MIEGISSAEFAGRRAAAVGAARESGMDGLVICARGGGTLDRYANVYYLSNFYSSFPYIPDAPGHWRGRAHSYLLLPVDGDPILVADLPYTGNVALHPEQVLVTDDVTETLIEAIQRAGLSEATVGLVGEDTIPLSHYRQIEALLPGIKWRPADHVLTELRAVKSPGEIAHLRAAAALGSRVIDAMMSAVEPGARHGDVVTAGMDVLIPEGGALYNSFMASGTGGESPTAVRHSFPTWGAGEPLERGQWFRLGISGVYRGYYFDVSRSKAIGGPTNAQIDAFEAAIDVVQAGISAARPGAEAGDLARAAIAKQKELGYPLEGVFSGLGHGIGLGWDSPWLVINDATRLVSGMVINVERTLSRNGYVGDFEETVLITDDGPELLTHAPIRYW